jgi:transcriptional regulator with XRE-family HTH domain
MDEYVYYSGIFEITNLAGEVHVPSIMGDKIRTLRKQKKLSLEQLAVLTESSKSYIWELENKDEPNPSIEKVAKIAAVLDVTPEFLSDTSDASPNEAVIDEAYFRKYKNLSSEAKKRVRQIIDVWDDE